MQGMVFKGTGAYQRSLFLRRVLAPVLLLLLVAGAGSSAHAASISCDPKGGISDFGLEWAADTCVSKGMNDSTYVHYTNNDLTCDPSSHQVVLHGPYGDDAMAPADFLSYATGITASGGRHFKIFRNKEGSHLLLVHPDYTGTIDGQDMTKYAEGGVYTDVFRSGFILPPIPSCIKTPHSCTEMPSNSTVNMISGRLSHSQELFSTKGGQFPLTVTLNYRNIPFAPSSVGNGWSHSYEISLQAGGNSTVTVWDNGDVRDYRLVGGIYQASSDDSSSLTKNGDGSYLLTEKNGGTLSFDPAGHLIARADTNGNATTFTYANGNLASVTDPNGRSATFTYGVNGKLASIGGPGNRSYGFAYTDGYLTRATAPDGGTWDYTYTSSGMMETKTDQVGNTSSYAYDASNRVIAATDPQGQSRSYGFAGTPAADPGKVPDVYDIHRLCWDLPGLDANNQFTVIPVGDCQVEIMPLVQKNGGGWQYSYENNSETLKSVTDPYNNTTSYTHDAQGNVLTKTEPGVGTTWYSHDANGNTTSVKDPLGNITTYTYNSLSQVLTTSGPAGNTSNTYDAKGNLTSSIDAAGATTTYEYDGKGNVTKISNALGQSTLFTYTPAGLVETRTDPAGIVVRYTYDDNGNITTSIDPIGTTTYSYDSMNRLTGITDPSGNFTGYVYDQQGNRTSQTDANGNTTSYKYSYQGQVTEASDALKNKTSYSYGTNSCPTCGSGVDKLTSLTDANQQTTTYQYDLDSRLVKETDPLGKETRYTYDAAGNVQTKTDANGVTVTFTYDPLRRLTAKIYSDRTGEAYSYDSAGRLLTAGNKDITYSYSYDTGGRLANVSDTRGFNLAYENDILGNRKTVTLQPGTADQHITTYTYDTANRPSTVTSSAGTFTYAYDGYGRRSGIAYPNGVSAAYRYDTFGRLTGITHSAGGTTIAFANYSSFDKIGNRKGKITGAGNETYSYDPVYRLTQVATAGGVENYGYDAVGNRLSGPGPKDTKYQYNAGNQMTAGRVLSYLYDANGNQTSRVSVRSPEKTWVSTWDYENRLVKMEKVKGAEKQTVSFTYDPLGRRVEKKLTTVKGGITKTSVWSYVYDGDNIALEVYADAEGSVTKTFYTHGASVDEHLALERGNGSYYYHTDGLGSVTAITDGNKAVVQGYGYDSFGNMKQSTSFVNSFTYTGREWDKETGLYYYRARYYDPMEGRFISKDPIGFKGGDVNIYAYVKNNPIRFRDPRGLDWEDLAPRDPGPPPPAENHPNPETCPVKKPDIWDKLWWLTVRTLWNVATPPFTPAPPGYGDYGPGRTDRTWTGSGMPPGT